MQFLSEPEALPSKLLIGSFIQAPELIKALETHLDTCQFQLYVGQSKSNFMQWLGQNRHRVDCLIFDHSADLPALLPELESRDIVLPTVILATDTTAPVDSSGDVVEYHQAVVHVDNSNLIQADQYIREAIAQFLKLPDTGSSDSAIPSLEDTRHFLLTLQQQRLTEKLQERLGYLSVYYKRNPDSFLRKLPPEEGNALLQRLKTHYRAIILGYFDQDDDQNQKIDDLVNMAFFADISVSQIVEIHMDLIDDFAKQLKLEGRSEEILLDYRLTLIDVIAHLCEMYRRSIPRSG